MLVNNRFLLPSPKEHDTPIIIVYNYIFYENDTNEVKGSYHDDCLEKRNKSIFCRLNWGMAVSCSRNMNFVKCRMSETSEENFFNV